MLGVGALRPPPSPPFLGLSAHGTHQTRPSPLSIGSPLGSISKLRFRSPPISTLNFNFLERPRAKRMEARGEQGDDSDFDDDEETENPFGQMREWLRNKPRGFGEGKEYDTSIEDKLLDEIEQSRLAQLANINNLKNNPPKPQSQKPRHQLPKATELSPFGARVCLSNLPKKKNIHRDLKLVFKGVPGIVNIVPVVSANKKTRDPICKGSAFIDLKSNEDASRFAQAFSGTSIKFGKIRKPIKCQIMTSASDPTSEESANAGRPTVSDEDAVHSEVDYDLDDASINLLEKNMPMESDESDGPDNKLALATLEESQLVHVLDAKQNTVSATEASTLKQRSTFRTIVRKKVVKRKLEKVPKFNIPGSATRLKVREKSMLTDVFAKYGNNAASS